MILFALEQDTYQHYMKKKRSKPLMLGTGGTTGKLPVDTIQDTSTTAPMQTRLKEFRATQTK